MSMPELTVESGLVRRGNFRHRAGPSTETMQRTRCAGR